MVAAAFSAIINVGIKRNVPGMRGKTLASTTLNPSTPVKKKILGKKLEINVKYLTTFKTELKKKKKNRKKKNWKKCNV
jgi:hypothetical protein